MRTRLASCLFAWTLASMALLAPPAAAQPRTLTIAVGGAFTSMDPHYHNLGPNNAIDRLRVRTAGPLRRQVPAQPPPGRVLDSAIDANTWEFKLRPERNSTTAPRSPPTMWCSPSRASPSC